MEENNQKKNKNSATKPFSRLVIAEIILLVLVIICMIFSWFIAALILLVGVFVYSIVVLILTIKQRQIKKGLVLAIVGFVLTILLSLTASGLAIYQSEPMSFARSARAYLDVSDVDQEFALMVEQTIVSSDWKELRSAEYGYLFQYPENWQTEISEDQKMAAVQWDIKSEDAPVSCSVIFTLTEKESDQTLEDHIAANYALLEQEYTAEEITRSTYTGFRTFSEKDHYGFADWFSQADQVFSFSQLNSGGEKDACAKITQKIEDSFTIVGSE